MGVMVDSGAFISFERRNASLILPPPLEAERIYISSVTVSELSLGIYYADTEERRQRRAAFVDRVVSESPVVDFTTEIARKHAEISAGLRKAGNMIGAHDLMIAATAVYHSLPIYTANVGEFSRVPGLQVIPFVVDKPSSSS